MCDSRKCQFCISGQPRIRLTDLTYAHEFENLERGIAWCEPCADSARYEDAAMDELSAKYRPVTPS